MYLTSIPVKNPHRNLNSNTTHSSLIVQGPKSYIFTTSKCTDKDTGASNTASDHDRLVLRGIEVAKNAIKFFSNTN